MYSILTWKLEVCTIDVPSFWPEILKIGHVRNNVPTNIIIHVPLASVYNIRLRHGKYFGM